MSDMVGSLMIAQLRLGTVIKQAAIAVEMSDNRDLEPDSDIGTQDIDVEDTDEGSESDEDLAAAIDRGLEELEEEDEDEDEDSDDDDDDDDDDEDDEDDEKGKHSEIGKYGDELSGYAN